MNNATEEVSYWYQEFWVWFIIFLMGAAITACIWTIVIAVSGADQMVSDNYYKDGLAINKDIALDKKAQALHLSASITLNKQHVSVTLSEPMQDNLLLRFSHPIEKAKDFSIELTHQDDKTFIGTLPQQINYHWYITLTNNKNEWRLKSTLNIEPNTKVITAKLLSLK